MAKEKVEKTNALRLLDRMKIPYEAHAYPCQEFSGGEDVARQLGLDPADVCKTLVTVGKSGGHYVFVLPVSGELDRKKAAALVGEKSLEMLHVKDLLAVTGYIRGGCTGPGDEEAVSHGGGAEPAGEAVHLCQRRQTGLAAEAGPGGPGESGQCPVGRCAGKRIKSAERSEHKSFASLFKGCGVWGPQRPGGTLPSGRPSRQARLAPHDLDLTAQPEKKTRDIVIPGAACKQCPG